MLGCDIVEIARVAAAAERPAFLRGVFTEREQDYWRAHGRSAQTLAGFWCAKEATAKALGYGFYGFRPCDIEITHTASGAPEVRLTGKAAALFPDARVRITVSHCKEYAMAVALRL